MLSTLAFQLMLASLYFWRCTLACIIFIAIVAFAVANIVFSVVGIPAVTGVPAVSIASLLLSASMLLLKFMLLLASLQWL
jgi:hypothetical protein